MFLLGASRPPFALGRPMENPPPTQGNKLFLSLHWFERLPFSPERQSPPFSSVSPHTCSSFSPPLSPAPTPWEAPCPLETHLNSGGDQDAGNGQEGPRRRGVASKPPHCGPNYHLASDRLVITGARGWRRRGRREEVDGYPIQTPILLCPLHLGQSLVSWEKQEDAGRGGTAERRGGAGTHRRSENPLWQSRTTRCQPGHCRGLVCIPE